MPIQIDTVLEDEYVTQHGKVRFRLESPTELEIERAEKACTKQGTKQGEREPTFTFNIEEYFNMLILPHLKIAEGDTEEWRTITAEQRKTHPVLGYPKVYADLVKKVMEFMGFDPEAARRRQEEARAFLPTQPSSNARTGRVRAASNPAS